MENELNCPLCGASAVRTTRSLHVRRGDRDVNVVVESLVCDACADPMTGEKPFRFVDPPTGDHNHARISDAWQAKYGEPLPKRGVPGRPTDARRSERVSVLLSPEEVAKVDRRRGRLSRSEFLRRAGLGG